MKILSINFLRTNNHNVSSNRRGSTELTSSLTFSHNSIDDERTRAMRDLDNKKANNGMTYSEAKNIIYRIKKYYMNNKETCKKIIPAQDLPIIGHIPETYLGLDPEKLPAKDKERFYYAKAVMEEIERNYPELAARSGVIDYRDIMQPSAHIELPSNNNLPPCDPGFMPPTYIESKPDNSARIDWEKRQDRFTDIFTEGF